MVLHDNCLACQHRKGMLKLYGDRLDELPTVAANIEQLGVMCIMGLSPQDYLPGGRKFVKDNWKHDKDK